MIALLCAAAWAGGIHAGIPVRGVQGLGAPSFLTATTGWTAPITAGGYVKVFVGKDEAEARDWYARAVESLTLPPAAARFADEALGDGDGLLVWRDGNVAALVRATSGPGAARTVAERLRGAIVEGATEAGALTCRDGVCWDGYGRVTTLRTPRP